MDKKEFLAFSLPYGLKVALTSDIEFYDDDFDDSLTKKGAIWELIGVNNTSDLYISVGHGDGDLSNVLRLGDYWITTDRGFKPALHPLYELTKDEWIEKLNTFACKLLDAAHVYDEKNVIGLNWITQPFEIVMWLIKHHFDVAGLIEKGEAIDVNTLPENPYK